VLTIGKSLLDAFDKIELLERASQMTLYTRLMEGAGCQLRPLEEGRLAQLMRMKYGPAR
jgi:L-fuculose-phosphate aldolase